MTDLGQYRVISDREPNFPWTKFEKLLCVQEIFEPQWEDGVPLDPRMAIGPQGYSPSQFVWMLMEDTRALGFILNAIRGKFWVDVHLGFRPGVPGIAKKMSGMWVMHKLFADLGVRKISAFVPEFNRPARVLARSMGLRQEGYMPGTVWRNGIAFGTVVYGVTRDEQLIWFKFFGEKRTDLPPEQPEWGSAECSGRPN